MAGGLFALLDDVAAMAKLAAASVDDIGAAAGRASAKAAGVVVDDTAVTPQFLEGSAAERELPIIKQIAIGSLRNKLLFILPAALVLSEFAPWLLPILLIFGGTFLAYEGAEKVWLKISGHGDQAEAAEKQLTEQGGLTPEHEKETVAGAIRTDFILSAEIMVIALKEVVDSSPDAGFVTRAAILIVVALFITLAVYGFVAAAGEDGRRRRPPRDQGLVVLPDGSATRLVAAMPKVLAVHLGRRHGRDAVGRWPHPADQPRRAVHLVERRHRRRAACAVRLGAPPRGAGPRRDGLGRRGRRLARQHPALGGRRRDRRSDRGGDHARAAVRARQG